LQFLFGSIHLIRFQGVYSRACPLVKNKYRGKK